MLRQYRACVVDLLGGVYNSIMRTTHPDLVCLRFVPSLYSTFEFFIYLSALFLCSVMIVKGILCCRFVRMCVSDSIVRKCVPVIE